MCRLVARVSLVETFRTLSLHVLLHPSPLVSLLQCAMSTLCHIGTDREWG